MNVLNECLITPLREDKVEEKSIKLNTAGGKTEN